MKKRCAHCGTTRFGLVRQYYYRLTFCSKRCKELYLKTLALERERIKGRKAFLQ